MRLGPTELILILLVVVLIFGIGKLPQIGKSLGEGLKSFKKGVSEDEPTEEAKTDTPEEPAADAAAKPEAEEKPKADTVAKT